MIDEATGPQEPTRDLQDDASLGARAMELRSAEQVAEAADFGERYRFLGKIAEGGMGVIYRAFDTTFTREVAIKLIHARNAGSAHHLRRFAEESRIAGQLQHPGIPPVHDLGVLRDGRPFLAMKLVKGRTLSELLPDLECVGEKVDLFENVCQAMAYAHSRGVIHRDLKPQNVMVGAFGETQVMDWGLAKVLDPVSRLCELAEEPAEASLSATIIHNPRTDSAAGGSPETVAGQAMGTYAYIPPEQAAGEKSLVGKASDVFGLGAILCEMLTGKPPYVGTAEQPTNLLAIAGRLEGAMARLDACEAEADLKAICHKCLQFDATARYADAGEVAEAVARFRLASAERVREAELKAIQYANDARVKAVQTAARRRIAAIATALLFVAGSIGYAVQSRIQSRAFAEQLLAGPTSDVPKLLPELGHYWAIPILEAAAKGSDPRRRLNASLALLQIDGSKVKYVAERLIDADPADLAVIVAALKASGYLAPGDPDNLRVAALAAGRGNVDAASVAGRLVSENPVHFAHWLECFRPVARPLIPAFWAIVRDGTRNDGERAQALSFLTEFGRGDGSLLTLLSRELTASSEGESGMAKIARAKDKVLAILALYRLGKPEDLWSILRESPDPTARTSLTAQWKSLGFDFASLRNRLKSEEDISAQRAIVLMLGEYNTPEPGAIAELKQIYRNHPDAGLHAAAEWSLRQWKQEGWLADRMAEWTNDTARRDRFLAELRGGPRTSLGGAANRLPRSASDGRPSWYVTGRGQPMAVLPGPITFRMGASDPLALSRKDESPHRVRIDRTFAVMARHVTVAEFLAFDPKHEYDAIRSPSPTLDCPVQQVDWYRAAAYCNWLSEREGIPKEQWCYGTDETGAVDRLRANYLRLTGYRLPTEAEMEYAARAGTESVYSFGDEAALLPRYGWYLTNGRDRTWPSGLKRPNDFGLFDVHGNVYGWCSDKYRLYQQGEIWNDESAREVIVGKNEGRILRGGAWNFEAMFLRSSNRFHLFPIALYNSIGIRPARTLIAGD